MWRIDEGYFIVVLPAGATWEPAGRNLESESNDDTVSRRASGSSIVLRRDWCRAGVGKWRAVLGEDGGSVAMNVRALALATITTAESST